MKLKQKLAFILTVIFLLSCFLIGCTPKEQKTAEESYTLPGLADQSDADSTGASEGAAVHEPDGEPGTGPAEIGESDSQLAPTDPAVQQSDPEEDEDGLEVESEYTFEIGDNLGVGGN